MRINAHRGTQQHGVLLISTFLVVAFGLVAGTIGTAAQAPARSRTQVVVTVQGMQCPFCAYGIKKHLAKLSGVTRVDVELASNQAILTVAPDAEVTDAQIQKAVRSAGFTPGKIERPSGGQAQGTTSAAEEATATFAIDGMRCLGCEAKITADLEQLSGVSLAQADWQAGTATVRYDANAVEPTVMLRTIEQAGRFQPTLKTSRE